MVATLFSFYFVIILEHNLRYISIQTSGIFSHCCYLHFMRRNYVYSGSSYKVICAEHWSLLKYFSCPMQTLCLCFFALAVAECSDSKYKFIKKQETIFSLISFFLWGFQKKGYDLTKILPICSCLFAFILTSFRCLIKYHMNH